MTSVGVGQLPEGDSDEDVWALPEWKSNGLLYF